MDRVGLEWVIWMFWVDLTKFLGFGNVRKKKKKFD